LGGRFILLLAGAAAVGLAGLRLAAPDRPDLLAAAASGALFAGAASAGGFALVVRASRSSPEKGMQVFLAVMTVKVLAFAAFLLTIALTTRLNPAALGGGLVGVTLIGEALAIEGLRRMGSPVASGGASGVAGTGGAPRGAPADVNHRDRNDDDAASRSRG
jgi:hypothetical protein